MVGPDPQGSPQPFQFQDQGGKPFFNAGDFFVVLGVGVFPNFKRFRIRKIAGVDAHFFHMVGGLQGRVGSEMDVGHQGNADSF
jgi:hypothetical protein